MVRRINIYAGPGAGKSVVASVVYSNMKICGYNIELVSEYVKAWAYEGRNINLFDQVYIFAHQLRRESLVLCNSDNIIITDSPVPLSICFAKRNGVKSWYHLQEIANEFEHRYPSYNIFLNRGDCKYKQDGRYETEEQAKEMDDLVRSHLVDIGVRCHDFSYNDYRSIIDNIRNNIG